MKIVTEYKSFMRIGKNGFEIKDIDINDKEMIKKYLNDKTWVECIRTTNEN